MYTIALVITNMATKAMNGVHAGLLDVIQFQMKSATLYSSLLWLTPTKLNFFIGKGLAVECGLREMRKKSYFQQSTQDTT